MPIDQVVGNKSIKQVCRPREQLPKPPQPEKGSSHMARASTFCPCPEDLEGCRQSLIQARREGSIGEYCIMEGLRANLHQCRQVLLEGLYDKTSQPKGSAGKVTEAVRQKKDFDEACKQVKKTIGGKIKFFQLTDKGIAWAEKRNIRIKKFKSGIASVPFVPYSRSHYPLSLRIR